jgi:hypothetical protein
MQQDSKVEQVLAARVEQLEKRVKQQDADLLQLAKEVLATVTNLREARIMVSGLATFTDMLFTMHKIHHDRLRALEQRAEGVSFEDMVDGKLLPLGPTQEHVAILQEIHDKFADLKEELDNA